MPVKFSLSREQFVSLLTLNRRFPGIFGGSGGDPGPYRSFWGQTSLSIAASTPDPDPYGAHGGPGPHHLWQAAATTEATLTQHLQALQVARLVSSDNGEKATGLIGKMIEDEADEICKSPFKVHIPKGGWPPPPPPEPWYLTVSELLGAGLAYHYAADIKLGAPVRNNLIAGADKLFATGLEQLEGQSQKSVAASA